MMFVLVMVFFLKTEETCAYLFSVARVFGLRIDERRIEQTPSLMDSICDFYGAIFAQIASEGNLVPSWSALEWMEMLHI